MLTSDVYNVPLLELDHTALSGVGKKKMMLIARQDDLEQGGMELLSNIMQAIKYTIAEDCYLAALPTGDDTYAIGGLMRSLSIKDVIIFGVNPKHLGMNIHARLYQVQKFENYTFLLSHKVTEMSGNRGFKLSLWQCLQALYLTT